MKTRKNIESEFLDLKVSCTRITCTWFTEHRDTETPEVLRILL